jgi:hypothetical protein
MPSLSCRHPSIRTLGERLSALGAHWVFSVQSALPSVRAPSRSILRWSGGKAKGAVAGTRHFGVVHLTLSPNYAATGLRFRVLWSGSYSSQLIQR